MPLTDDAVAADHLALQNDITQPDAKNSFVLSIFAEVVTRLCMKTSNAQEGRGI